MLPHLLSLLYVVVTILIVSRLQKSVCLSPRNQAVFREMEG